MPQHTPGDRVVAIRDADQDEIRIFGHGTYVGDHPRPGTVWTDDDVAAVEAMIVAKDGEPSPWPEAIGGLVEEGVVTQAEADERLERIAAEEAADRARPLRERAERMLRKASLNPRIELDDGGVVWGFQCWWRPSEGWEDEFVKGRRVVTVPLPQ